jgi:eukaryotic-like serine/threonine-protein kinase
VIHTGHASQLWQAYDDGNQRMVAVKCILESAMKDLREIGYLRQEFKIGRLVAHPHVVEYYSQGVDKGIPYLAMEWFAAPNLKRRIRAKGNREEFMLLVPAIIEQAAEALAYVHDKGFLHLDIKPDNFLVNNEGQVKLIDFGLGKKIKTGLAKIFAMKSICQGTPSYMSPEHIRRQPLDARADVYSFGCALYELFAGTPPFTGLNREDLFKKHLRAALPSLEAADRNVTPEFAQLVRRCLAKKVEARPASAGAFLEEFHKLRVFKYTPRRPNPAT